MFYRYWVLKEAYVKAKGEGLSCPLESFSVSFDTLDDSPLLEVPTDPEDSSRWSLKELDPGHGYIGALVAEGHEWMMKCYELDGF
jgi:4'-phosphopantetheinyl transferase